MSVRISVEGAQPVAFRAVSGAGFRFDPEAWIELAYESKERRTIVLDGKRVSYEARFTPEGMAKMVAKFRAAKAANPEHALLVNVDHLALQPDQKSEAAAWIEDVKIGEDGHLYGKPRWTTLGSELAMGGVYRFPSVEVDSDETPRADWPDKGVDWDRLDGAAITNDHALKRLRPFSYRTETEPIKEEHNTPKGKTMIENLKKLLGLAPEATEADVEAAVKALQDKAAADEAAKAEAEMAKKAEEFRSKHGDRFVSSEAALAFYRSQPDQAEERVALFRVAKEVAPVSHRQGGNPDEKGASETPAGIYRKYQAMPDGPEKEKFFDEHREAINAGSQEK